MYKNKSPSSAVLAAVAVAQLVVAVDISVVNVALPAIRSDLGFSATDLAWVVDAYALLLGGLLLLGGRLADMVGQRRTFLAGLAGFGIASLAAGLAQTPWQLVVARGAQGAAAAALTPAALALLTTTFPAGPARARALGVWGAVGGLGGAVGVIAGGLLTQYAGWRWTMLVNVPVVVAGLLLAARVLPLDGGSTTRVRLDVPGAVLGSVGLGALVLAILEGEESGWTAPSTVAGLLAAVLLLSAFVVIERRTTQPLFRLDLLAVRPVATANLFAFLLFAGQFAAFYLVSLYIQRVLGHGAAVTGLAFLPFCAGLVAGTVVAARLAARRPPRTLLGIGGLVAAAGFAWFGMISADGSLVSDVLGPSVMTSLGLGMCLGPVAGAATGDVPPHEAGMASGLVNTARQIGGCLGLAVLTTVASARSGGDTTDPVALTAGYALGLQVAAALLLCAALAAIFLLRPVREAAHR
jgi:EmrB/QacA subfamily drug resistance transporter